MVPFRLVSEFAPPSGSASAESVCSACGARVPQGFRFCPQCGRELSRSCPRCGQPTWPQARFCGSCGAALPTATAPEAPSPPPHDGSEGAGRRVVTVLFADLVGFTPLSEGEDPEVMREFLSGYFDLARTVITRTGGVVEKFIGDAVMAVWGATTAQEDDAEQAVRAGLELITEISAYGEQQGRAGLQTRVGVVTGPVATWAREQEGLVVGDRVNLASRVQAAASPGTVLVDAPTREASHAGLEYLPAGSHRLKGIADPVDLWRAVRVVARRRGAGRSGSWEAPFVGRSRELAWCKDLFHDVSGRRRARLLSITGLAGVGKSRLTWELEKYLDGLESDTFLHRGRCLAYGDGVAFWPLAEMMRSRLGLQDEEETSGENLEARVDRGLAALDFPSGEVALLRQAVYVLLGLEAAPMERAELFAAWRRIFELLGDRGTVVMVFDDCQWADSGLFDFAESLLDWSANSPLLVITLARPELGDRRPGWGTGRPTATALALEPLSPAEMEDLLAGLVPGLPATTTEKIVSAAEGIPLYAVELVRALAERGSLVRRGERYSLVGEVFELPVPATLTALLAARLDTLSPRSRALASRLSVFAGAIPRPAIQAVADLPEAELEAALAELRRAEVLAVRTDALAADRGQYVFTQGLLRTAAHDRLGRAERRAAHLAAAAHLQQALPDSGLEVAEAVAMHLEAALEASAAGDDTRALRTEAAEAFSRAGARARAVGAPASSARSYRRARQLDPEHESATQWRISAVDSAVAAGHYEEALAEADPADAGVEFTSTEGVSLTILRMRSLTRLGRNDEAVAQVERALEARGNRPPDAESARLRGELASLLFVMGQLERADAAGELALAEGQAFQVPLAVMRGAEERAWSLAVRGRVEEALVMLEWCVRLVSESGSLRDQARVTMNLGDLEAQYDRPGSVAHFETSLALSRRAGALELLPVVASNLAWIWGLQGHWSEAQQITDEYLERAHQAIDLPYLHLSLAPMACWRGDVATAAALFTAAAGLPSGIDAQLRAQVDAVDCAVKLACGDAISALRTAEQTLSAHIAVLGVSHQAVRQLWPDAVEAALRTGDYRRADEWLAQMASVPPGLLPPYLAAHLARLRGLQAEAREDREAASGALAQAVQDFTSLGYPYWIARSQLDEARILAQLGDPSAAPLAAAAEAIFSDLGAGVWEEAARRLLPPALQLSTAASQPA